MQQRCTHLRERPDGTRENSSRLPHLSASLDAQGRPQLQVRPPIKEAMKVYFRAATDEEVPVTSSMQVNDNLVYCILNEAVMLDPDREPGAAAVACGFIMVKTTDGQDNNKWYAMDSGNVVRREAKLLMHGTDIQSALDIIEGGGRMSVTENGPGGQGVYCFKVDKPDCMESMMETYRSTETGAYSKGAALLIRPYGLVIKAEENDIIPPGS